VIIAPSFAKQPKEINIKLVYPHLVGSCDILMVVVRYAEPDSSPGDSSLK